MKKHKYLFISLLVGVLCTGCVPDLGAEYNLPNGYQIVWSGPYIRLTSDNMVSYVHRFEGTTIPGKQDVKMASNTSYTGLIFVNSSDVQAFSLGENVDMFWYLVDEENEDVFGPFTTEKEFQEVLNKLKIQDLGPWRVLSSKVRVQPRVVAFCYNDQFVGAKNVITRNTEAGERAYEEWYLLDGINDVVYGPYQSEQDYNAALTDMNVSALSEWISTATRPK